MVDEGTGDRRSIGEDRHPWVDTEREVSAELQPHLAELQDLLIAGEALAVDVLKQVGPEPRAGVDVFAASTPLLLRALQDARATEHVARLGYVSQASTIAASAFEVSNAIGMIGGDAVRAQRWLEHADPDMSPWPVWDCVRSTIVLIGEIPANEIEGETKREYQLYKRLCTSKHANPLLERRRYLRSAEDRQTIARLTPRVTPGLVRQAQLALLMALRAITTGLWCYAIANLSNLDGVLPSLRQLLAGEYRFMTERWTEGDAGTEG